MLTYVYMPASVCVHMYIHTRITAILSHLKIYYRDAFLWVCENVMDYVFNEYKQSGFTSPKSWALHNKTKWL